MKMVNTILRGMKIINIEENSNMHGHTFVWLILEFYFNQSKVTYIW